MILFARNLKQNSTPPPTPTNEDRLREFRKRLRDFWRAAFLKGRGPTYPQREHSAQPLPWRRLLPSGPD